VSLTNDSQGFVLGNVIGGVNHDLVALLADLPPPLLAVAMRTGFKQSQPTLQLAGGLGMSTGISTTNVMTTALESNLVVL
jgi:hypothetical protein